MAHYFEDILDIELENGTMNRSFLNRAIGEGDENANRFGVRLFRNGEPVEISGTCQGFFMAPNGTNILVSGSDYTGTEYNKAWVQLPQACYDYEGQFALAIKIVDSNVTGTMRIVDGVVNNTGVTGAVAPTGSVPTYQEIISQYDEMVEATEAAEEAADNVVAIVATPFSTSIPYISGKYVTNDGKLYMFITDHEAGQWDSSEVIETKAGSDLADLTSAVNTNTGATAIRFVYGEQIQTNVGIGNVVDVSHPVASSVAKYAIVPCSPGDVFTLNLVGGSGARALCLTDENYVVLSIVDENVTINNGRYIVPSGGAYLILNSINDGLSMSC